LTAWLRRIELNNAALRFRIDGRPPPRSARAFKQSRGALWASQGAVLRKETLRLFYNSPSNPENLW